VTVYLNEWFTVRQFECFLWNAMEKKCIENLYLCEASRYNFKSQKLSFLTFKTTRSDGLLKRLVHRSSVRVVFVECNGTKNVSRTFTYARLLDTISKVKNCRFQLSKPLEVTVYLSDWFTVCQFECFLWNAMEQKMYREPLCVRGFLLQHQFQIKPIKSRVQISTKPRMRPRSLQTRTLYRRQPTKTFRRLKGTNRPTFFSVTDFRK
jgi:hypothetical protein